jgi:outer membrane protein assembly factor BamB
MHRLVARSLLSAVIALLVFGSEGPEAKQEAPQVPDVAPAWTTRVDGSVLWQRVTPLGNLVISTSSGLYGLDPLSGDLVWKHGHLRNVDAQSYSPMLNTPFVIVEDEDVNDRVLILDSMDGRILFDSQVSGISQVLSSHLLPRRGALLIFGLKPNTMATSMLLLDIASGKPAWINDDILAGQSKLARFATVLLQAASDSSKISAEPMEVSDTAFLVSSGTGVIRIDARNGKVDWQIGSINNADRTRLFFNPERPELFFAGGELVSSGQATTGMVTTYYRAFRVADGSAVWDKPIKLKGSANDPIFLDGGLIFSSAPDGSGKLKLVEYDSGRSVWGKKGKGIDVNGSVIDHRFLEHDILLTTGHDSAWTNKGVVYQLNVVDPGTGALRFGKSLKVKGRLLRTETLPKGVLYVTTSEVNVLDLQTGRPLHDPIVSDGSLITAERGERLYAFSKDDGALYVVDKPTATMTKLTKQAISLGDKDLPDVLEIEDGRITMISSQNVVAISEDGTVQFHAHHPAPRQPTWMRALYTATAVRAAMASATSGVYSGSLARVAGEEDLGPVGQEIAGELARGYGELAEGYAGLSKSYFKAASQRFKASATTCDFVFMLVKSQQKGVDLARVSKATGEIVDRIPLGRDREPQYQVDAIDNRVYYMSSSNEVAGYTF